MEQAGLPEIMNRKVGLRRARLGWRDDEMLTRFLLLMLARGTCGEGMKTLATGQGLMRLLGQGRGQNGRMPSSVILFPVPGGVRHARDGGGAPRVWRLGAAPDPRAEGLDGGQYPPAGFWSATSAADAGHPLSGRHPRAHAQGVRAVQLPEVQGISTAPALLGGDRPDWAFRVPGGQRVTP